jgi:glucose-6-phosphate 1-dehydrogenase
MSKIKATKNQATVMEEFKSACSYMSGSYDNPESFKKLEEAIVEYESTFPPEAKKNRLFYLALPPSVFAEVSKHLKENCHGSSGGWNRLIVEKPFGHDLQSSNELSEALAKYWEEKEIYRIDHYLGKVGIFATLSLLRCG